MRKIIYKITHPFVRLYWRIFKPKTYGSRALILHGNKILLARNINVSHWSLPGGKIDYPESPEQCLMRELKEELDLSIAKTEFKLGEYLTHKEGKRDTVHIFVVKLDAPRFEKQWELEDAQWFDLGDLPQNIGPAAQRRIAEYLRGSRNLVADW
ncbi:MAG: NUDIX domain-containing protein [Candidatus Paceibacterota bacterium]|jgi:8-oxo-dGTP pyrophosphatase MutT (NUDIX family)